MFALTTNLVSIQLCHAYRQVEVVSTPILSCSRQIEVMFFLYPILSCIQIDKLMILIFFLAQDRDENGLLTNAEEIKSWKKRDSQACNFIYATVTEKLQDCLMICNTAAESWRRLSGAFLQRTTANKDQLWSQFYDYKFNEEKNVLANITAVESLAKQLKDLEENISDVQITRKVVNSLPSRFKHFRLYWDHLKEEEQTIDQLTIDLGAEERRLKAENLTENTNVNKNQDESLFAPHYSYYNPNRRGQRGAHRGGYRGSNQNNWKKRTQVYCDFHNSFSHSNAECRVNARNKRQKMDFHANLSSLETVDNSSTVDHSFPVIEEFSIFLAESSADWYADSGTTRHMSGDPTLFNNLKENLSEWYVRGVGNTRLPVKGVGDVLFKTNVNKNLCSGTLKEVLFVPNLSVNLVSVGSVTEREGVQVLFVNHEVIFTKNGLPIVKGNKNSNGLYRLDIAPIHQEEFNALSVQQTLLPLSLWHQRLGHISKNTIELMAKNNVVAGLNLEPNSIMTICEGCMHGKLHRTPFPKGRALNKNPGGNSIFLNFLVHIFLSLSFAKKIILSTELIHADLCGPMQVSSPNGTRYFMTCRDDATGYTEVFFLQSKDEAATKFKGSFLIYYIYIYTFFFTFS